MTIDIHMNQPLNTPGEKKAAKFWYNLAVEEAIAALNTQLSDGLITQEAAYRLQEYGANALLATDKVPWYMVLARQFIDVLIAILLIATGMVTEVGWIAAEPGCR